MQKTEFINYHLAKEAVKLCYFELELLFRALADSLSNKAAAVRSVTTRSNH